MNALVSRRALLGATAAVGAVALPTVAEAGFPASHPDAALFALLDHWHETKAAWDATDASVDEAMRRAVAAYPPMPDALRFQARDFGHELGPASAHERLPNGRFRGLFTVGDVERLRAAPPLTQWAAVGDEVDPPPREPDLKGEARRREIIAAHDAWNAACQRVRDEVGFTAASEAEDAAGQAWNDADEAMKLRQPRTLAGLVRKAEWVAERLASGGCDDLGEVFARQVVMFGGVAS